MRTTSVSTAAISAALRNSLVRMQSDLVRAQKEVATGRVADAGLALGGRAAQSVSFQRDVNRLSGIVDSNALVSSRLASTQDALGQIADSAQTFLGTLTASTAGNASPQITLTEAKATLEALSSIANTSLNGEHLFAGVNTDVKPLNDFSAGSPAKAAFDAAFLGYFGFAQNNPAAGAITEAQMNDFLTNAVEPQFFGAGWDANWSNATDERIVSRIALNETVESSISANTIGIRRLAMAAAAVSDLFDSAVGPAGQAALVKRAISLVGNALGDIANAQAETGIAEKRVEGASERLSMQIDLFELNIQKLEGVDPYEASTRLSTLLSQIETSYTLTARIKQLSLARFLS